MEQNRRLIDADVLTDVIYTITAKTGLDRLYIDDVIDAIDDMDWGDAVEVVRCKDCGFGKPYERNDGKTGYYCGFCGHSFRYGTSWESVFNPIKEADDFCSYGERRNDNG